MTAVDRWEALSAIARRRNRSMVIPEYSDGRIFRPAIYRAYRVALKRREIWRDGGRRCHCGRVPCALLTTLRHT